MTTDVAIIGAGAAGLSAAGDLVCRGLDVTVLEGRDRLGGRIFSRHLPSAGFPIELGAEFVHGRPQEIWDIIESAQLETHEVGGERWCHSGGRLAPCPDLSVRLERLLDQMSTKYGDRSFQEFVESEAASESLELKSRAVAFVEGFNAAHAARISVQWLIDSRRADEAIAGDHSYRIIDGYGEIVARLAERVEEGACDLRLGTPIRAIRWRRGRVTVVARDGEIFEARRAVIAVPLGVLNAPADASGGIAFDPDITCKRSALAKIAVGTVIRVVLVFRERFWERLERCGRPLSGLSFLFSNDEWFPTWWSTMPARSPILTGWAAGQRGERLSGKDETLIVAQAIASLAALLDVDRVHLASMLDKPYLYDWQADPFSRGAYSYVLVGGAGAPREVAAPLEGTLFFAGEATDTGGHNGTVHGAIASGRRAAQDVLASFER